MKDLELDLGAMMARKAKVVKALTVGVAGLFKKNKVESINGRATLVSANRLIVRNGNAERSVDATASCSSPAAKATPLRDLPFDGKRIVSSTEALALPEVPKRLLVVGAGAVGLELGSVWRASAPR